MLHLWGKVLPFYSEPMAHLHELSFEVRSIKAEALISISSLSLDFTFLSFEFLLCTNWAKTRCRHIPNHWNLSEKLGLESSRRSCSFSHLVWLCLNFWTDSKTKPLLLEVRVLPKQTQKGRPFCLMYFSYPIGEISQKASKKCLHSRSTKFFMVNLTFLCEIYYN